MLTRANAPYIQFLDEHGKPLDGGTLTTYVNGTTQLVATFKDKKGTLNPPVITLDFKGMAEVWLDPSVTYRFLVKDKKGRVWRDIPDVTSDTMTFTAQGDEQIRVEETTDNGRTVLKFSLQNTRPFIPDSEYLQFKTFDNNIVVTLCDELKDFLAGLGYNNE